MGVSTGQRATSLTHPRYRLTAEERRHLAWLAWMGLWTRTALAEAFGVSRRTVQDCYDREFGGAQA